jgi:hypothetical protein
MASGPGFDSRRLHCSEESLRLWYKLKLNERTLT